jgi:tripartite-type tricarboxylate transporter receptor subunit TctC
MIAKVMWALTLFASLLLVAACSGAGGQGGGGGEPRFNRPIEMVVPFGPGGGADQVARISANVMGEELGIDMPVVNTPGGTGSSGMTSMLSRPPGDAMATLIQDSLSTVAYGSAAFDLEETQAVCRLQEMPSGLFIQGDGPYEGWEDLAEAARESPGEIRVATVGEGGVDDVILASLAETQGTEFRAVPFAEPGERYAALLSGEVDALYEQFGDVRSNLESGDFESALAFAEEPIEGLDEPPIENDPTLSSELEGDIPVLDQFRGLVVNAETEPETVEALSEACAATTENPNFQESQELNFSSEDSYQEAEEFQSYLQEQLSTIEELQNQYGLTR